MSNRPAPLAAPLPVSRLAASCGASATVMPLRRMTGHQKAAVMMRLMTADGAEVPLTALPQSMQESLAEHIATLRRFDEGTLRRVVEEFLRELDRIGLSFPGGVEAALDLIVA